MTDRKSKETVTTIHLLDGEQKNVRGEFIKPSTTRRNVFTRVDGSHYIVTSGHREDVFLQEDGTFREYLIGHTVRGGPFRGVAT